MTKIDEYTKYYCADGHDGSFHKHIDDCIETWLLENPDIAKHFRNKQVLNLNQIFEEITYSKRIRALNNLFVQLVNVCKTVQEVNFNTYLNIGRHLIEEPIQQLVGSRGIDIEFGNFYERISKRYFPGKTKILIPVDIDKELLKNIRDICYEMLKLFDNNIGDYLIEFFPYEGIEDLNEVKDHYKLEELRGRRFQLVINLKFYNFKTNQYFEFPNIIRRSFNCMFEEPGITLDTEIEMDENPIIKLMVDERQTLIDSTKKILNEMSAYSALIKMLREDAKDILAEFNFITQTCSPEQLQSELKLFYEKHNITNSMHFTVFNGRIQKHITDLKKYHSESFLKERPITDFVQSELLQRLFTIHELESIKIALVKHGLKDVSID